MKCEHEDCSVNNKGRCYVDYLTRIRVGCKKTNNNHIEEGVQWFLSQETINIGKHMRYEAKMRGEQYKVSKAAIDEMISYVDALIDKKIGEAVQILRREKRTVILDRDMVLVNSGRDE